MAMDEDVILQGSVATKSPVTAIHSPTTPMTPGGEIARHASTFEPYCVRIEYIVSPAEAGLVFHLPDGATTPYDYPYMYSTNYALSNRLWLPCVDNQATRCLFEIEVTAPRFIGLCGDPQQHLRETQIICSGDLQASTVDEHRKRVLYRAEDMSASDIILAVGPWVPVEVPLTADDRHSYTQYPPNVYAFCLPELVADMKATLSIESMAMSKIFARCCELVRQPFPFNQFKLVFVDGLRQPLLTGQSVTLLSTDLLHDGSIMEDVIESRKMLTLAVTSQIFGQWFYPHDASDTWLVTGLCNYIAAQYMKFLFGKNEYKTRMRKDITRVCFLDKNQLPLTELHTEFCHNDPMQNELLQLKSPLIIHLLERQIAKANFQKVLLALCDPTKRDFKRGLRTSDFLRMVKKTSSKELRSFAEQWIYGSGCPEFTCSFRYNKKKNVIEFYAKQTQEQYTLDRKERVKYSGPLTVRVIEPDRPYDHVVNVDDLEQKFDLTYNANIRKIRATRRLRNERTRVIVESLARERAAGLRKQLILSDDIRTELNRPATQRLAQDEDNEDDDTAGSTSVSPIEWLRVDPEMDWLATFHIHQDQGMWMEELSNDIDVSAQYQSINALCKQPSAASSVPMLRLLIDPYLHHAIRSKATQALASFSSMTLDAIGVRQLLMVYRAKFCYATPSSLYHPLPLLYDDVQDYFLHVSLLQALGSVKTPQTDLMQTIRDLLLLQLTAVTAGGSALATTHIMATIIRSIGLVMTPQPGEVIPQSKIENAKEEVYRWLHRDALLPSHQNEVTVAVLEVVGQWMLCDVIPLDMALFLTHSAVGNDDHVRMEAFRNLVLLGLDSPAVGEYLLSTLVKDPHPAIRWHVLQCFVELARLYYHADVRDQYAALLEAKQKREKEAAKAKEAEKEDPNPTKGLIDFSLAREPNHLSSASGPSSAQLLDEMQQEIMLPSRSKLLRSKNLRDQSTTWRSFAKRRAVSSTFWRLLVSDWAYDTGARLLLLQLCRYTYASQDPGRLDVETPQEEAVLDPSRREGGVALLKLKVGAAKSTVSLTKCRPVLRALQEHPHAIWFLEPVREEFAPGYHQQIKHPMDLETMSNKLKKGKYRHVDEFKADVELIFANCFDFNPPGTEPYIAGQALKRYYEGRTVQKHFS